VLEEARNHFGQSKPIVILMHTLMGKGVDFMENDHNWHGVAPNDDQLAKALAQLPETLGDY
jgi:transketolase